MNIKVFACLAGGVLFGSTALAWAEAARKEPQVPPARDFVRSIALEGYAQRCPKKDGAQYFRLASRYLDPDVNAFVGMVVSLSRFNKELKLEDPANPWTSMSVWNWGGNVGIVRGAHLWEVDLMGASFGSHLGPAISLGGEHTWRSHCVFYHRVGGSFFADPIGEADQGLRWRWKTVDFSVGYRFFASRHEHRSGPHAGMTLRFQTPKIPFIFPSIG